jgi:hypothetical protein
MPIQDTRIIFYDQQYEITDVGGRKCRMIECYERRKSQVVSIVGKTNLP